MMTIISETDMRATTGPKLELDPAPGAVLGREWVVTAVATGAVAVVVGEWVTA